MDKIASPQELTQELRRLLAYAESEDPSREKLAAALGGLANRVAGKTASDWKIAQPGNWAGVAIQFARVGMAGAALQEALRQYHSEMQKLGSVLDSKGFKETGVRAYVREAQRRLEVSLRLEHQLDTDYAAIDRHAQRHAMGTE